MAHARWRVPGQTAPRRELAGPRAVRTARHAGRSAPFTRGAVACSLCGLDEHELAWAAGFFDGDGWAAPIRYGRGARRRPSAQINQSSLTGVPEALIRFRDAVGVGRIGGPKIEAGREPLYWWVASSRGDVLRTGALIGPWLSQGKRGQFAAAVGLRFEAEPIDSFAWAAGLFDAEGATSLSDRSSRRGYKAIEAAVTQGGARVPQELARFASCLSLGRVNGPYDQAGANELVYGWRIHTVDDVRRMLHVLSPWLGGVKRHQAFGAMAVIDGQPTLPRGRVEWGSHKTHCIHGHEYATARLRPYVSRSANGMQRRASKQRLICLREHARLSYAARKAKIGGQGAADQDVTGA